MMPKLIDFYKYLQEEWFDDQDSLFLIGFVLVLVFYLVLFIIDDWYGTSVNYATSHKPNIPMVTVNNPFTFQVKLQSASFRGLECSFSCSKDCYVLPVWGVPIYHLFDLLNLTWMEMKSAILIPTQDQFTSNCVTYNDLILLKAGESQTAIFRPPYGFDELQICDFRGLREKYPFAAIMLLQNEADVQDRVMVAMASAVHLPHSIGDRPPHIIGQYLKPRSGAVGIIRKTYLSSPESVNSNDETIDLCSICYHRAISVVILPCCHACLCATCLRRIENCPLCRRPAESYFELSTEDRE